MKILIEKYRGFDIHFDTTSEAFSWTEKESKSFAAVKKDIDDYKKDNQTFEPFEVVPNPDSYSREEGKIKIIGIRKDGRFIYEHNGEKKQISEYNEKDWLIYEPSMDSKFVTLAEMKIELDAMHKKVNDYEESFGGITLKDYKKQLTA